MNWPTVASVVIVHDTAIIPYGRADRGQGRLHGVNLGSSGDSPEAGKRIWKREDTGTFVPTPAVYKDKVYVLRDRGEIECIEPASGKTLWRDAFPKASSNFYASPVIANGKLYAIRENGTVFVANIENGFQLLAENDMGERVVASPAALANRLLIRGEKDLICIANN